MLLHEPERNTINYSKRQYQQIRNYYKIIDETFLLFDDVLFLLLVRCWKSQLLLSLVIHHLLHEASCLSIKVGEFTRFGVHFFRADFWFACYYMRPPLHLIHLRKTFVLIVGCKKLSQFIYYIIILPQV